MCHQKTPQLCTRIVQRVLQTPGRVLRRMTMTYLSQRPRARLQTNVLAPSLLSLDESLCNPWLPPLVYSTVHSQHNYSSTLPYFRLHPPGYTHSYTEDMTGGFDHNKLTKIPIQVLIEKTRLLLVQRNDQHHRNGQTKELELEARPLSRQRGDQSTFGGHIRFQRSFLIIYSYIDLLRYWLNKILKENGDILNGSQKF